MKKSILNKIVSTALIASVCVSAAACDIGPGTSETSAPVVTTTETTRAPTENTETTETSETTEAPTPTPLFTRAYSYTLYEDSDDPISISMYVNIDDYFKTTDDGEVFELFRLASDLGWLEKDMYTYDDYQAALSENPDQKKVGHSNWFTYAYGDHKAVFTVTEYIEDIEGYDDRQVSMVSFEYIRNEFSYPYFEDANENSAHDKVVINIKRHFKNCDYEMEGQHCRCSREDAIVIAYSLWCIANSPNTNMPIQVPFEPYRDEDWDIVLP